MSTHDQGDRAQSARTTLSASSCRHEWMTTYKVI